MSSVPSSIFSSISCAMGILWMLGWLWVAMQHEWRGWRKEWQRGELRDLLDSGSCFEGSSWELRNRKGQATNNGQMLALVWTNSILLPIFSECHVWNLLISIDSFANVQSSISYSTAALFVSSQPREGKRTRLLSNSQSHAISLQKIRLSRHFKHR